MSIPFTQYLRPDGRTRPVTVDRPADIEALAKKVIDKGWTFCIEELRTGEVSMTVSDGEVDVAVRLCDNGPSVPAMIDELVKEAASL